MNVGVALGVGVGCGRGIRSSCSGGGSLSNCSCKSWMIPYSLDKRARSAESEASMESRLARFGLVLEARDRLFEIVDMMLLLAEAFG